MPRSVIPLAVLLLAAGAASAQVDPGENGIGLYFDDEATQNCRTAVPYESVTSWVLLTNPTEPAGVAAFECRVDLVGNVFGGGGYFAAEAYNMTEDPEYLVCFTTPLPWAPTIRLVRVMFLTLDDQPIQVYLGPISRPSVPGEMVYVSPDDIGKKVPMHRSTGAPGTPVATINGDCVVPAENESWGAVKALYR